jgi:trehalose PTS system EIIBC or EIIBCA component
MTEDYGAVASRLLALVGGRENVNKATHCMTRLRLALRDDAKLDTTALLATPPVKGIFATAGVTHIVIGAGEVEKVHAAFLAAAGLNEATQCEVKAAGAEKLHPAQRLIRVFSDVFQPILPAIVVSGLLMGVNNLLGAPGLFIENRSLLETHPQLAGLWGLIDTMANTAFVFLPALVGWSAAKRFGGSEVLGIVLGLLLVHPDLLNGWGYGPAAAGLNGTSVPYYDVAGLFRIERVGYQGQILPILAAAFVMSRVERFLKARVAGSLHLLVVPMVTIVVSGFLALAVIGPATRLVGAEIVGALMWVHAEAPLAGAMLFGVLYAPLVITGMHHMLIAVDLQLIAGSGGTFVWPMIALSNIAQGSAALAVCWMARGAERNMASTAALSAFFGITEPAMFGVNLPRRGPFYAALAGSALAAVFITLNHVLALGIGVGGLPAFISIRPDGFGEFLLGTLIALAAPFGLSLLGTRRQARLSKTP